jgi:hypothetical protein
MSDEPSNSTPDTSNDNSPQYRNPPEIDAEIAAQVEELCGYSPIAQMTEDAISGGSYSYLPGGWEDVIYLMAEGIKSHGLAKEEAISSMLETTRNIPVLNWAIRESKLAKITIDCVFEGGASDRENGRERDMGQFRPESEEEEEIGIG